MLHEHMDHINTTMCYIQEKRKMFVINYAYFIVVV